MADDLPSPSPNSVTIQNIFCLVGTCLSILFLVVLSSFSLVYPFSTLSSVGVLHLSSSHACTSSIVSLRYFRKSMCLFLKCTKLYLNCTLMNVFDAFVLLVYKQYRHKVMVTAMGKGSFHVNSTNGYQVSYSNIAQKIPKITLVSIMKACQFLGCNSEYFLRYSLSNLFFIAFMPSRLKCD